MPRVFSRRKKNQDRDFMAIALDMARLGFGRTSPNPAVGAVIVKGGRILATGFHRKAGEAHAEIEAMRNPPNPPLKKGGRKGGFSGATLYVTLEPCCHHGRTPPCTDAIIKSGIKEVVVGMKDPDPKVAGRGISVLRKAGVTVRVGIMEKECRELNVAYIVHRTQKRPFVTLKMAMTLDGKVGMLGRRIAITGPEALEQSHLLRDQSDAILVGSGTIFSDNPRLTTRLRGRSGRDPVRIVLEGRRRVPASARVFKIKSKSPAWRMKGKNLSKLLHDLGRRGIVSLLVEGGPRIWSSFLKARLVDRLVLFVSPHRLGLQGLSMLPQGQGLPKLKRHSHRFVGTDIMIDAALG